MEIENKIVILKALLILAWVSQSIGCGDSGHHGEDETENTGTSSLPDSDSERDGDTSTDSSTDIDTNIETDTYIDTDTKEDTDTNSASDTDGDTDTDGDGDTDTDGDGDTDTDGDGDTDADTDTDADGDTDSDGDGDTDSDTDADADADGDSDTDADTAQDRPCDPACADDEICVRGSCTDSISGNTALDAVLFEKQDAFDNEILISQQPDLSWQPSSIYRWKDFLVSLHVMANQGIAGMTFWLGDPDASADVQMQQGLVNIAAFLAQSMKETIQYDACDENNWDNSNNYKISNACGQLGQSYADYDCDMACPRDPTMAVSAVTHAKWFGAPGPMFCAPDSRLAELGLSTDGTTGYWSIGKDCWPYPATEPDFALSDAPPYLRPTCEVYVGQKGGEWVWDGSGGSVEGCCWWGRGVIQTTGRCNFGTLNHYLGQTHLNTDVYPAPANPLYPTIDFCKNPEVICSSTEHPELKWIAGLFYWMSSVQSYQADGWQYETALKEFVSGGLMDDGFINAVSGIVNRGCHNPPCESGSVDGGTERLENFQRVLTTMGIL
jgi:hypothetical protein